MVPRLCSSICAPISASGSPFASSDHRRLADGVARSSTNSTASIWRSRWTPNDNSRASLHTRPHRSLRTQQEGGVRTALAPFRECSTQREIPSEPQSSDAIRPSATLAGPAGNLQEVCPLRPARCWKDGRTARPHNRSRPEPVIIETDPRRSKATDQPGIFAQSGRRSQSQTSGLGP